VHEKDDIAAYDGAIAVWLQERATPGLTAVMLALTTFGAPLVAITAALVLAGVFWFHGQRPRALFLALTVPLGMLLNTGLKHAFARSRPMLEQPLATAYGHSFPSGHVAGATLLYGALSLILLRRAPTWKDRCAAVFVPGLVIATVAFTRLYLGVHYLTDVLAAHAVALSWVALCATAIDTLRRRRAFRADLNRAPSPPVT
jgi:undecaprenyl-diphosphatase